METIAPHPWLQSNELKIYESLRRKMDVRLSLRGKRKIVRRRSIVHTHNFVNRQAAAAAAVIKSGPQWGIAKVLSGA
jgi:hypothetical protein